MPIDPEHIQAQKFRIAFRGYDVEAVDAFLYLVQAELAELLAGRAGDEGAAALSDPPADLARGGETTSSPYLDTAMLPEPEAGRPVGDGAGSTARAVRTLVRAEQMAEQMIADAVAECDELRAVAGAEAEQLLAAARTESDRVQAELQSRREREVGALVIHTQRLRTEVDRLSGLALQYQEGLRAWLSEQERLLEQRTPLLDVASLAEPPPAGVLRPAA